MFDAERCPSRVPCQRCALRFTQVLPAKWNAVRLGTGAAKIGGRMFIEKRSKIMSAKLASCRRRNRFGTRSLILSALGFVLFAAPSALPGATTFYVDPDRTGAQTGAAASPWASFSSSAWAAINSALLANDVTVYVSALKADTTQQSRAWFLEFQRSVSSSHRLTIDGCSLWNTNAVTPSWRTNAQDISIAYTNRRVFMLTGDGASQT